MLGVVSHDAGGAEVLSSYVRQCGLRPVLVLEGPAKAIFALKLGSIETVSLPEAAQKADAFLCGTSWQSDLEVDAIRLARGIGIPSAAFLDHWTNYRERFTRHGESVLPDDIWVGDRLAEELARAEFPDLPIRVVENPYLLDIRRELQALSPRARRLQHALSVLYVAEPVREHETLQFGGERRWGYAEEDALRYFLSHVSAIGAAVERIVIRPHPAEPRDKYAWASSEFNLPIECGGTLALLEEIASADVVVGCESMALVVGLIAGKRVISCIPPGGRPCALPHPEIIRLSAILAGNPTVKAGVGGSHE